jgi:hypothetical protein
LLFELPERLWSGAQFDPSGQAELIALRREARGFLQRQKGVRKSTTTTATTDGGEAARGNETRLCGVLHIATIGHDLTRALRPLNPTPAEIKIRVSFTLALVQGGANLVGWPVRQNPDQHSTTEGPR